MNSAETSALIGIFVISIFLGFIKFGALVDTKTWSWQHKFAEIWNSITNFLLAGFAGYYFFFVRWPLLSKGEPIGISDFAIFVIFAMGLFGHLVVVSFNITNGIEAILKRVLEK